MQSFNYRGLSIVPKTECMYFCAVEGDTCSLVEDTSKSTITLTYTPGINSSELSDILGLECTSTLPMLPMSPKRLENVYVTLNGLRLRKTTIDPHVINIVIVCDSESRVVQDYGYTTIVVSKNDYENSNFVDYLFYSGGLSYLVPDGRKPEGWVFRNFPKIIISGSNVNLESESEMAYTLRKRYDDYVIRSIDYQDQFILEIRTILDNYGVELVRSNKETYLQKPSYVTYQFTQTPGKSNRVRIGDFDRKLLFHHLPIEFSLHTTDMVLFYDFKNKYSNVDLLTDFTEFKTTDKYGSRWSSSVKWRSVTEDFNHTYGQDDNSNFSWQCHFGCDIQFYEMIDEHYVFLEEIAHKLNLSDKK